MIAALSGSAAARTQILIFRYDFVECLIDIAELLSLKVLSVVLIIPFVQTVARDSIAKVNV